MDSVFLVTTISIPKARYAFSRGKSAERLFPFGQLYAICSRISSVKLFAYIPQKKQVVNIVYKKNTEVNNIYITYHFCYKPLLRFRLIYTPINHFVIYVLKYVYLPYIYHPYNERALKLVLNTRNVRYFLSSPKQ